MLKKIFLFVLVLVFIFGIHNVNAEESGAGFIPANIWYSKDPFMEGDKIKIYTLIFNPDSRELSGVVSFFDKEVLLGKKNFKVLGNGVKDISIDWTATAGKHLIKAKIEETKFLVSAGKYEDVYLEKNETTESKRTVLKEITLTSGEGAPEAKKPVSNDKKIQNFIVDNTPSFITEPIITTIEEVEYWRENHALSAEEKSEEMKMYKLWHFILNNKIIFYGTLILLILALGRYLLNKIL